MIDSHATQDDAPGVPPVPSFESLRDPRRRSAIDVLVPLQDSPLPESPGSPVPDSPPPAAAPPPRPPASPPPAAAPVPRPPDYADLLRLGVHLARYSAGVPLRLVRWSAGLPV